MKNLQSFSLLPVLCFILAIFCSCEKKNPDTDDGTKTLTVEYWGGSFRMVLCPGGTFLTNNDDDDLDFEDGPEVTVEPFWISEIEVTNELLAWIYNCASGLDIVPGAITGGQPIFDTEDDNAPNYLCEDYVKWGDQPLIYMGGSQLYGYHDIELSGGFNPRENLDAYPCTDITWYGAIMACNWLTEQGVGLGNLSKVYSGIDYNEWWADQTECNYSKTGFRLPTTAEWECAARWQGSDSSGDCYEYPAGSGNYWTRGGSASGEPSLSNDTEPVKGDREPNVLGLYDMTANVWEWCYDEEDSWRNRIIRSGDEDDARISAIWSYPADGTASNLGFRLVISADDK
ncbi:MAG: SUMF1/EgtB/PvdO family nonheme iron enzyme [Marinilabiliaceae bacterium]|jgi:formylglycine-generating enzyme required for sulfatase activity|nr:SUMF1/EgtB/PvdO family nonheme iron enzyme [Marinilabiliaceae bacterium]